MGYALSHSRKQRIHIESSMFASAMVDFTVVITDSMVSELAEAGGLLDSAGPALSDGYDMFLCGVGDGL
jgi:CheY-specific phosphatase CheX